MSRKMNWSAGDILPQGGKVVLVTGANSGLGYQVARVLAGNGARVIMACRNRERGEAAREMIGLESQGEFPENWSLDLADLSSVRSFADRFLSQLDRLDLLINNAGLMAIPHMRTVDGFEMQFGVNHLGHYALTALLWPLIGSTPGSRIVNVSSGAYRFGKIRYHDIHWERGYGKWRAYGMSKLANLLFTKELARRITAAGLDVLATSAHPGYAATELQAKGPAMAGRRLGARFFTFANGIFAQSAFAGARPLLYAATADHIPQGSYFGPSGLFHLWGGPVQLRPDSARVNDRDAQRLWELSAFLTGHRFPLP